MMCTSFHLHWALSIRLTVSGAVQPFSCFLPREIHTCMHAHCMHPSSQFQSFVKLKSTIGTKSCTDRLLLLFNFPARLSNPKHIASACSPIIFAGVLINSLGFLHPLHTLLAHQSLLHFALVMRATQFHMLLVMNRDREMLCRFG